jgi:hypothetical protein
VISPSIAGCASDVVAGGLMTWRRGYPAQRCRARQVSQIHKKAIADETEASWERRLRHNLPA